VISVSHILLAFAALCGWVVLLLASPTRRCARCKGTRLSRHWLTRRQIRCPRCRGTGRHSRRGAAVVHGFAWRIFGDLLARRDRDRRDRVNGRQS
jgi:hypothetical protein